MTRLLTALLAILALGLSGHAEATKRVALVIGNGEYVQVGSLDNPARDARAMGEVLRNVGFDVVQGIDLDRAGMQDALKVFSGKLNSAEVALFYYAGHGIQVEGENYLIPIDAQIENETDLAFATVPLGLIEEQMSKVPRVKLIMLDACRDNPFKMDLMRTLSPTRAVTLSDGLAPVSLAEDVGGTFIAFATDPGAYASDGLGRDHAPFTQALLDNMSRPGIEIHEMMIDVRAQVWEDTGNAQRPWSNSSLTGKFYFSEPLPKAPAPTAPASSDALVAAVDQANLDLAFWQSISDGGSEAEYQAYLNKFPNGVFAEIARARITAGAAAQIAEAIAPSGQGPAAGALAQAPATLPESSPQKVGEGPSESVSNTTVTDTPGTFEIASSAPPTSVPKVRDIRRSREATTEADTPAHETARAPQPETGVNVQTRGEDTMKLTHAERVAIERYLSALGMDTGRADGIFDEKTRAAIRAWQWMEELPPTGFLTYRQIDLLRTHALTTAQLAPRPEAVALRKIDRTARKAPAHWPSAEIFVDRGSRTQRAPRVVFKSEPNDENLIQQALREIEANLFEDTGRPLNEEIEALRRQNWYASRKEN
jgi:uncharacterized caspase-like protein